MQQLHQKQIETILYSILTVFNHETDFKNSNI